MSLRLLLGILAPGPPDQQNDSQSSQIEITPQDKDIYVTTQLQDIQNAAKLHIGMLSISLIVGLALVGFTILWMEKKPFLNYVISLLIALVCRTFFSILFDGVIILGYGNVSGGNALLAFEQIFINLVLAFWLSLTIYLHARVQRNFKSEPTLNLYRYGVPGAAVFFAFIWIFLLQAECPYQLWWFLQGPFTQWVVNSFNLLCILIQLALVGDIARIMMKTSLDNDSASLFRKVSIMMGVLVFIFWLQFGLYLGRVPLKNSSSYTYFFYFVDGIQCGLVCLILYFFNNWVLMLMYSDSVLMGEGSENSRAPNEELLAGGGGRGIVTLDSVFMTSESGKLKNPEREGDVVYSNVVDPERWLKILDLYTRLNKHPNQQGTVVEGDIFYDCPFLADCKMSKRTERSISEESSKRLSSEDRCVHENGKTCDRVPKKTAFYSSKYLVLESKCEVPKYLETRPSLSSMSGRGSSKEGRMSKDYSPGINSVKREEFVRDWLSDNSKNTSKKDSLIQWSEEESDLDKKPSELDAEKQKPVPETALTELGTAEHTKNRQQKMAEVPSKFPFPSKPQAPLPVKNEKFLQETPTSNAHIREPKDYEPKRSDAKGSGGQGTYLNQYMTNSELQERLMSREKRESDQMAQASKSIFGFTGKMSSIVDYLVNGGSSLLGLRTHQKSSNTENLKPHVTPRPEDVPVRQTGASSGKTSQWETFGESGNVPVPQTGVSSRKNFQWETFGESGNVPVPPTGVSSRKTFRWDDKIQLEEQSSLSFPKENISLRTDPKSSNTENLKPYVTPRPEVVHLRREALYIGETEIKGKSQLQEVSDINEEGRFPVKRLSISSGSEFSIERTDEEQPRRGLGISTNAKLPKSIHDPRLFAGEKASSEHTSSESTVESRKNSSTSSGSFYVEAYYQGLHNLKQKIEQRDQQQQQQQQQQQKNKK